MNIVEYKDSNFEEIVTLVDDFAKHIVDLDTKHCTKKFSSIAEAEAYTRQIVTDQRTPIMIQILNDIFERNPLISIVI